MDAQRWQRLNDLFHGSINRRAEERRAWLEQACAGDQTLVAEIERLVRAHDRASQFLRAGDSPQAVPPPSAQWPDPGEHEFTGTERFAVRRKLGVGGMGVVYEVHDRTRDEIVALKSLRRSQPAEIYRLKREFRSLIDVAHPNLVSLYELFVEDDECFFTMELVDGVTFVDAISRPLGCGETLEAGRVRALIRQLLEGVAELHRRGKLHRDLKPSNVLVTREDRVVILDFGLVAEKAAMSIGVQDHHAGTPAYLSPERAMGAPASEASDWYGVGVTLYEAVTGHLPVAGAFSTPDTRMPLPGLPEDLDAICLGLIHRDPAHRLGGNEALRRLQSRAAAVTPSPTPAPAPMTAAFVGRDRPLTVLRTSLEATRSGRAATVYVCGPSGIGKSALVRHFLEPLASEPTVVLWGRCYENESIPYKGLDGVVDSLSHYLASLPAPIVAALLPRHMPALARLFPVLGRVLPPARAAETQPNMDLVVLRRIAFAALRELLVRMAAAAPLVVVIDDLHWADADSALLLEELLRPPDAPAMLVVACLRTEVTASKPFLRALVENAQQGMALSLGPLSDAEARALVDSLMAAGSRVHPDDVGRIVRDAEGNPFLLEQIARYVSHRDGASADTRMERYMTVGGMLDGWLRGLPAGSAAFLQALAICGRPMPPAIVRDACGLSGDERPLVTMLRAVNLVRTTGTRERIEVYHDRIREALTAQLDGESARRVHRHLARTIIATGIDDPEALCEHYRAGGQPHQASLQAAQAARKATNALAFDRAALFYRQALELAPGGDERAAWTEGLATALANAGRPAEAGAFFLRAAAEGDGAQRLELQRRGAEQFLIGGHIDRGVEVIQNVLAAVGMRFPRGGLASFASLLLRSAQVRWRGLEFVERPECDIAPEVLRRVDTCWSVATGMAFVDNVRSLDFQLRHLLLALDAGEPYRVARAFAAQALLHATRGGPATDTVANFARLATDMSERIGHPHAIAFTTLTTGLAALLNGHWREALILCRQAQALLREKCVGVTWELNIAQSFHIAALLYLGEFREAADRLVSALDIARDCGNIYLEAELRTRMNTLVLLVADEPEQADQQTQEVMRRWWSGGFTRQHYSHMLGCAMTALYRGDSEAAWRTVVDQQTAMRQTFMFRNQVIRIETAYVRGRCAIALAGAESRRARGFRLLARREARKLEREAMPWSNGFALLLRAALAFQTGDASEADRQLAAAADAFDRAEMKLYWAAAARRRGILLGNAGHQLLRDAETWMAEQGVRNPRCMTRMVAPGFVDA
jgi:hypothetical protein